MGSVANQSAWILNIFYQVPWFIRGLTHWVTIPACVILVDNIKWFSIINCYTQIFIHITMSSSSVMRTLLNVGYLFLNKRLSAFPLILPLHFLSRRFQRTPRKVSTSQNQWSQQHLKGFLCFKQLWELRHHLCTCLCLMELMWCVWNHPSSWFNEFRYHKFIN